MTYLWSGLEKLALLNNYEHINFLAMDKHYSSIPSASSVEYANSTFCWEGYPPPTRLPDYLNKNYPLLVTHNTWGQELVAEKSLTQSHDSWQSTWTPTEVVKEVWFD